MDDVSGPSSSSRDESLECVVVGMKATCVLSEDEDDEVGVSSSTDRDPVPIDEQQRSGVLGLLGAAALVSPFFLWGTSMVAMKEVLPATSPLFVASVRLVPAGLILGSRVTRAVARIEKASCLGDATVFSS